ncbi:MAG TPA: hypothetical protein P5250_01670, partial [Bacteroidales bacterium]|nr:hypothetical protein [Bacteroidales bacterium]
MNIKGKKKYFYYLKKILISVFIFFLAIVTICTFITLFYSDKIKDYVVAQINKQLSTELYVEKIEFTALKKFPYISLVFNNLTIKDAINSKNKKDLLKAEKLYLQFNLWDFFKNNYKVKKIELSNATIRLIVFKNGSDNYHFLKTDTTDKENDFSFYLQKIILQNTNFYYVNFINGQNYSLQINRITLNGNFAQTNYSVIASGNSFVNHIKSGQIIYLHNKNLEFKISLDVNDHYYKFKKALLKIGEINFNVEGEFIDKIDNQYLNICIKGENLDLEDFSKELPSNYYSYIANYEAKGKFDLIACVKGYVANNNTPEVEILANLKNAKLKQKYTSVALNDINMNFKFSNGTRKSIESSFIEVNNFSGKLKTGNINGNFKIVNFKQPNITLNVNGALELNTVNDFIHIDTIETITGNIKGNIFFHGQLAKVANFTVKDYINSKVEGEIKVDNCTIKLKNSKQKYANISGDFV